MTLFSLIILAIGLSMDSFAVSLTSGVFMHPFTLLRSLRFSATMALFQGVMPILGWIFGVGFRNYIEAIDHWIALILLLYLGGRMIYEAMQNTEQSQFDPCCYSTTIGLAIATSIDAMAVGISLTFLRVDIISSAIVIGITTLIFSIGGLYIGHYIGNKLKRSACILGGIILILIGVKICIEHIFFP